MDLRLTPGNAILGIGFNIATVLRESGIQHEKRVNLDPVSSCQLGARIVVDFARRGRRIAAVDLARQGIPIANQAGRLRQGGSAISAVSNTVYPL